MKSTRLSSLSTAFCTVAASIGLATVVPSAASAASITGSVVLDFLCNDQPSAACTIGEEQFDADVSFFDEPQVLVAVRNSGPANSSITKINIFDPNFVLSGVNSFIGQGTQVAFSVATESGPNGNNYIFTADGNTARRQRANGLNPQEGFSILFDLNTVLGKLVSGNDASIELTASGFGETRPERNAEYTFISVQRNRVPEPMTLLGSAAALGFGALMKRHSSKLKAHKDGNMVVEPVLEKVA
jgi:hypothetical protein